MIFRDVRVCLSRSCRTPSAPVGAATTIRQVGRSSRPSSPASLRPTSDPVASGEEPSPGSLGSAAGGDGLPASASSGGEGGSGSSCCRSSSPASQPRAGVRAATSRPWRPSVAAAGLSREVRARARRRTGNYGRNRIRSWRASWAASLGVSRVTRRRSRSIADDDPASPVLQNGGELRVSDSPKRSLHLGAFCGGTVCEDWWLLVGCGRVRRGVCIER